MQPDLSACLTIAALSNWFLTLLSLVLTWPVCALAMVVFVGVRFQEPVSRWIENAEAEYKGIRFGASRQTAAPVPPTAALVAEAQAFPVNSHVAWFSQQISAAADGPPLNETRESKLLRFAVFWRLTAMFEWIYSVLLGSQMRLLERLRIASCSVDEAREHYLAGKKKEPSAYANYAFESWLSWLRDHAKLIVIEEDRIELTFEGRYFFEFLKFRGYSYDRFG